VPGQRPLLERQALHSPLNLVSSAPRGRSRWVVVACAAVTVALGLGSRELGALLPRFVAEYAGDVLYATLVFFLLAAVVPRWRGAVLASLAFLLSCIVEASQCSEAAWLKAIRARKLGRLILGTTFVWSDFPCYAVGAIVAFGVDRALFAKSLIRTREEPASLHPRPPS
jgi:hypothetical protein